MVVHMWLPVCECEHFLMVASGQLSLRNSVYQSAERTTNYGYLWQDLFYILIRAELWFSIYLYWTRGKNSCLSVKHCFMLLVYRISCFVIRLLQFVNMLLWCKIIVKILLIVKCLPSFTLSEIKSQFIRYHIIRRTISIKSFSITFVPQACIVTRAQGKLLLECHIVKTFFVDITQL